MFEANVLTDTHMIPRGVCWRSNVFIYYQRKFPLEGLGLFLLSDG
jgi:hypothetical protein